MRKSLRLKAFAVCGAAAALPLAYAADPASAAIRPAGTFYAMAGTQAQAGDLVKVTVDSAGKVTHTKVVRTPSSGAFLHPMSHLLKVLAGEQVTYPNNTATSEVFTMTTRGKHFKLLGKNTSVPSLYSSGKRVAFVKSGRRDVIHETAINGRHGRAAYKAKKGVAIRSLAASSNGKVLYAGLTRTVTSGQTTTDITQLVKIVKGRVHKIGKATSGIYSESLALSPNGRTLAVGYDSTGIPVTKSIRLIKVRRGGYHKVIAYQGAPRHLAWSAKGRGITFDDQNANGWAFLNVKSGKVRQDDFTSTAPYEYPTS